MAIVHPIDTIVSDPNIRDGQHLIAGTQIRVTDIVASHLYRGLSPDALAVNFTLNLGQVYAALAYYYQHKADIDAQMRANAEQAEQLREQLDAQGKLTRLD